MPVLTKSYQNPYTIDMRLKRRVFYFTPALLTFERLLFKADETSDVEEFTPLMDIIAVIRQAWNSLVEMRDRLSQLATKCESYTALETHLVAYLVRRLGSTTKRIFDLGLDLLTPVTQAFAQAGAACDDHIERSIEDPTLCYY